MRNGILGAAALAGAAVALAGQDAPLPGLQRPRSDEERRQVRARLVATDSSARTLTVKDVRIRDEAQGFAAPGARPEQTFTLAVAGEARGQLERHRAGDWLELTCLPSPPAAARPGAAAEATPGPVATGTGAAPGTGTTGVGTTGTGISGTGTPAPGKTMDEVAAWIGSHCALVTAAVPAADPGEKR